MTVSQQRLALGHRPSVPGSGAGMAMERQPSLRVAPSAGGGAWGAVNVPQGSEVISRVGPKRRGHLAKPLWCCEAPGRVLHLGERPGTPGNRPPAEHAPASGGDSPRDPGT